MQISIKRYCAEQFKLSQSRVSQLTDTCDLHNQMGTSCNKSVDIYQDVLQLADVKSLASCQQTCCKLIVETCYPQARCKLFQQVVGSLQMTSCNKPDFSRLLAT